VSTVNPLFCKHVNTCTFTYSFAPKTTKTLLSPPKINTVVYPGGIFSSCAWCRKRVHIYAAKQLFFIFTLRVYGILSKVPFRGTTIGTLASLLTCFYVLTPVEPDKSTVLLPRSTSVLSRSGSVYLYLKKSKQQVLVLAGCALKAPLVNSKAQYTQ